MIHDTNTCDCDQCRWADNEYGRFNQKLVACELCGHLTPMTGTKRCDRCWELEGRIRRDIELARKILRRFEEKAAEEERLAQEYAA